MTALSVYCDDSSFCLFSEFTQNGGQSRRFYFCVHFVLTWSRSFLFPTSLYSPVLSGNFLPPMPSTLLLCTLFYHHFCSHFLQVTTPSYNVIFEYTIAHSFACHTKPYVDIPIYLTMEFCSHHRHSSENSPPVLEYASFSMSVSFAYVSVGTIVISHSSFCTSF